MAEMTLTNDDRRELEALIARRCNILDTLGRQKLLADAGVDEIAGGLNWGAAPDLFAWQLVKALQDRGTLDTTHLPALVSLVRELRRLAKGHEDEVAFLDRLLAPYPEPEPVRHAAPPDRITVLFLAANPRDTTPLRLGEEVRTIKERLREASLREKLRLEQEHAVRWPDVSRHLLDYQPHVVHFAGHGDLGGELVFEDAVGQPWQVPVAALSQTFRILKDNVRCVVLNACWSKGQAEALVEHVDFVVGMTRPVPDDAAIRFAAGFYRGLGYGRSVQDAFDLGKVEMAVAPSTGDFTADPGLGRLAKIPELLVRPGVDPGGVALIR